MQMHSGPDCRAELVTNATREDKKVTLKLYDSANNEIASQELAVSSFGTFNTTTTLPDGAPLGTYRIEVDGVGLGYFDIEEYSW